MAGSVLRFHGRIMLGSFSERSRIMLGTVSDRSRIGNDTSAVFSKFVSDFGRSFFVAGAVFGVTYVAPRIVNSVSCVKRIQHEIHFSWQAKYLVRLEDDTSCSAHCK